MDQVKTRLKLNLISSKHFYTRNSPLETYKNSKFTTKIWMEVAGIVPTRLADWFGSQLTVSGVGAQAHVKLPVNFVKTLSTLNCA